MEKRFTSPFCACPSLSDRSLVTATPSLSVTVNGSGSDASFSAPPASSTYICFGSSATVSMPGTAFTANSIAHSSAPAVFISILSVFFIFSTPQKSTVGANSTVLILPYDAL